MKPEKLRIGLDRYYAKMGNPERRTVIGRLNREERDKKETKRATHTLAPLQSYYDIRLASKKRHNRAEEQTDRRRGEKEP